MEMDLILEDMDEEKHRIRYTPFVKKPHLSIRDIPIYATSYDNERKKQARRRRFKFGNPRDQAKWVMDEHADIGDEDEDNEEETWKTHWNTTLQAKMASIALIFSTSNLIRFPFSCYLYGGIIFFLVYSFIVILLIQPLIFFEMLIGQFSTNGIKGFSKLDKYAHGLPYAVVFICLIFATYNNAVVGYNGIYAWSSLYTNPAQCDPLWNTLEECVPYENLMKYKYNGSLKVMERTKSVTTSRLSTELFFREYVLDLDWTGEKLKGNFTWKFLSGLVVVFILAAFVVQGRLTSIFSKVLICASAVVPILVAALYIHQYSLQGASSGRAYFSHFRWEKLQSIDLWSEAIRMAFTTAGVGFGLYTHIASRHNFYFDQLHSTSWLVCGCLMAFSSLAALVVFTELGILGDILNADYFEIFSERSGISFICLSGSLYKLSFLPATFVFFICMNVFGIWGQIVSTEMCSSFAAQFILKRFTANKRLARYSALVGVIILQLGFASVFGTEAGHIMLDSGHLFGGAWAAVIILLTEMFTAFILYGYHVFIADIEIMMDYPLPALFQLQMKYFTAPALCITLILMTIHWFRTPVTRHNTNPLHEGKSVWFYVFGVCLNLIPVAVMVVCALHTVRKTFKVGHLDDTVEEDIIPRLIKQQHIHIAPKQFRERLYSISRDYVPLPLNEESVSKIGALPKEEWEAHKWLKFHQNVKKKLITLQKYMRAKCRWEKAANMAILSYLNRNKKAIKSIYQAVVLYVREKDRERHVMQTEYLTRLIAKCSIENMIGHFDILDKENEEEVLLDHLLRSTPLPDTKFETILPQQHEYGEIYNKLIGRIAPSREEQYEALLSNIKQQLGIKDTAILRAIRKRRFLTEYGIKTAKEDAPLEFTVPLKVTISPTQIVPQTLNIIIIKGKNHSLLRKLPVPRPLVLKIPYTELGDMTMPQVHHYLISLASRYIAPTVLKEVNPIPPNPKIEDNLHKQVYDFLNHRCTCIIVLEEEPFNWEKREEWVLKRTSNKGIRQAVIPQNVEVTLAQMIRRNTINARTLSRAFMPSGLSSKQQSDSSSSSSYDENDDDYIPSSPCPETAGSFYCINEENRELPRLVYWNERVPPGDINALREARRYAKYMEQFGHTSYNVYPPKEEIINEPQPQQTTVYEDNDSDEYSGSSKYSNPSLTYLDDLKQISSAESLHGSIDSKYGLLDVVEEIPKQSASPEVKSLLSLKPAWSKISNPKNVASYTIKKHEEFGVHRFDSEHHYKKRRLDHATHLERRLNNNRRDFVYYSAGKCLIVQMKRDNAFIFAESGDSIASAHDNENDTKKNI